MHFSNIDLNELLEESKTKQIVCFGAGKVLEDFCRRNQGMQIEKRISLIVDNDKEKWGKRKNICGTEIKIGSPQTFFEMNHLFSKKKSKKSLFWR